MLNNETDTTVFVINVLTNIFGLLAFFISMIIFICIVYQQYRTRMKRQERTILTLSANIYFYIFLFNGMKIVLSVHSLLGDLYGQNFDSGACTFSSYFVLVLVASLYYGFIVQGIFRLCRIVYSSYRRLQFYWVYVVAAPVQLLVAVLLMCPVLVWHNVVYVSSENFCFIRFSNIRATVWIMIHIHVTPLLFISLIYIRIIVFLRHQPPTQSIVIKRRQERDLVAIRRIILSITLLFVLAIPTTILLLKAMITGLDNSLTYRITMVTYAISTLILSVQIVFITPQLKRLISSVHQCGRVAPLHTN